MKLKKIVPPFDLCKRIPDNAFQDSVLAWFEDPYGIKHVFPREVAESNKLQVIPAPTLEEIIQALPKQDKNENKLRICPVGQELVWSIGYDYFELQGSTLNLTEAALRLFLKEMEND